MSRAALVVASLRQGYAKAGMAFMTPNRVEQLFSAIAIRDGRQTRIATIASALAHDLNCDLTIIASACGVARDSCGEEASKAIEETIAATQRAIFKLSKALTWSSELGAVNVAASFEVLVQRDMEELRDRRVL